MSPTMEYCVPRSLRSGNTTLLADRDWSLARHATRFAVPAFGDDRFRTEGWNSSCQRFRIARSCLQYRSRSRTTNRTVVRRFLHLYRAFSSYRNLRLTRSTWLFVRTRRHAGLFRKAIILANFSAVSAPTADANSGTARNDRSVISAA